LSNTPFVDEGGNIELSLLTLKALAGLFSNVKAWFVNLRWRRQSHPILTPHQQNAMPQSVLKFYGLFGMYSGVTRVIGAKRPFKMRMPRFSHDFVPYMHVRLGKISYAQLFPDRLDPESSRTNKSTASSRGDRFAYGHVSTIRSIKNRFPCITV